MISLLLIPTGLCFTFGRNVSNKKQDIEIFMASSTWATFTTASLNGSVNSMHDSYTPLGALSFFPALALGPIAEFFSSIL